MTWVQIVVYSSSSRPMSWSDSFFYEFSFAVIAGVLSPPIMVLARRLRLEKPHLFRNILVHAFASLLYGVITRTLWELWTALMGHSQGAFIASRLFRSIIWGMSDAVPLYWLIVVVHYALDYYRRYQNSLVKAAELNAQLARAQLQGLRMQLHPHFLFNTLHAISELIHENPVVAERMVIGLSQLLRLSLETSTVMEVPLHQELHFTQLYLSLEEMRFDDRLQITTDIDPPTTEALVPNLILQPLVENAIKHGISEQPGKGEIYLGARRDRDSLILTVRDNGPGLNGSTEFLREGIGLSTTRERLLKLYGTRQSFHFMSRAKCGAEAVIRLPFKLAATGGTDESNQCSDRR
jgi:two-component system LytT family sensor kinase